MKPLTQVDLAGHVCEGCDHEAEWIHSRCHPSAGMRARYSHKERVLVLACRKCNQFVCMVAVASEVAP